MEFDSNGVAEKEFKDSDISQPARLWRYQEYISYCRLPFLSTEQNRRLKRVCLLRKRDNQIGLSEGQKAIHTKEAI